MVPIDLLDIGLPQTFYLQKTKNQKQTNNNNNKNPAVSAKYNKAIKRDMPGLKEKKKKTQAKILFPKKCLSKMKAKLKQKL